MPTPTPIDTPDQPARAAQEVVDILTQVDLANAINCTGPGEVGCRGVRGWHSWTEHRRHVAAAQTAALAAAGLLAT